MNLSGLTANEASSRLKKHGANEIARGERRPLYLILWGVVSEPMVALLGICATVYLSLGEFQDGALLIVSVFVVMALTLYQEARSTRALEALRDLSSPRALVIRDGQEVRIPGREVVPGDLLVIREGDRIAADARLLQGSHLQVDESLLTGESVPVSRSHERHESVLSSTLVTRGFAVAEVTQTGANTQVGQIGRHLERDVSSPTRLEKEIAVLVRRFGFLAALLSFLIVIAYGWTRGDWPKAILAGVAAAISLLPEELPVILAVFFALGAWRLSRRQVLVRQPRAIENLGGITVLCVDKTGTLTKNEMQVKALVTATGESFNFQSGALVKGFDHPFHPLIEFGVLASHKDPFDPMEKAIRRVLDAHLAGSEHAHQDWQLEREYPLSPELMAMSCVWKAGGAQDAVVVAAKGAPEAILDLCHVSPDKRQAILTQVRQLSDRGLRVLGVARGLGRAARLPDDQHDFDFSYLGLIGLEDPLRAEVPEAIAQCHAAGIRVLMMTGDYPGTAISIARQAGLPNEIVMTGDELEQLEESELKRRLKTVHLFARMVPNHKLRIVEALKADGEVVAMTGDGVNDAPSLKWADVGIAMGKRGTDVAREAADLVLLDDHFASIVAAIGLGRRIFQNIQNAMGYVFAIHVPIAGLAIIPVLCNWPMILFPAHIVFLELMIDPSCTLIFESDPITRSVMRRGPRRLTQPLFGWRAMGEAGLRGLFVLGLLLGLYIWTQHAQYSETHARALIFTTFAAANLALIVGHRPLKTWISNRIFWWVSGFAALALMATLQIDFLQQLFGFSPLDTQDLWLVLGGATLTALTGYIVNAIWPAD